MYTGVVNFEGLEKSLTKQARTETANGTDERFSRIYYAVDNFKKLSLKHLDFLS